MSRAVETIMELTGCSEDDAQRVYAETNDVEDAVDKILPPAKNAARRFYDAIKPVRVYTEEEKQKYLSVKPYTLPNHHKVSITIT